jgi:hypothetical protein
MDKTLSTDTPITAPPAVDNPTTTAYPVIAAISFSHLLNDMMQSVLLAIYPLLKLGLDLSFTQIGLITLTYQFTASLLQPLIGLYTDRRPMPYSLPLGMGFTLVGLLYLSQAGSFGAVLLSAMLIGMGSSVFHPESSGSPAWRPATSLVWPSLCSRSAAIWDRPSAPCSRRSSSCRRDRAVRPGSRCSHSSGSSCSASSAAGPATMPPASIGG